MLDHFDNNLGKLWQDKLFQLQVQMRAIDIFGEFINIFVLIILVDKIIAPIDLENSLEEVIS
jgi:hypothetical protein